jgi:hypothetical protein
MGNTLTRQERQLAARNARRAAQRDAALQPVVAIEPKSKNWVTVVIGAGGTAVWIALVSWSYTAATVGDMIGAGILLVLAFLVAVAALMASERYGGFANRRRLILNMFFAGTMATISGLLFWWEYHHQPLPSITSDEIAKKVLETLPSGKSDSPRQFPSFEAKDVKIDGFNKGIVENGCFDEKLAGVEIKGKNGAAGIEKNCKDSTGAAKTPPKN